eukprot:CAMPEP_0206811300 /NCGR_PEP_ID=MMETSP0975-20121206/7189_1 /ASSEMBLY_ACC=CAM_ASM_000399 /TAXON_ID=483370 /ORGANISM="non described non described, Strain CCMP2097" /LENGTH=94 /DNA_ID=CAMNT_0054353423 /DNA_START=83 /DNA_END=368 /DNA_ORIENTATION=+
MAEFRLSFCISLRRSALVQLRPPLKILLETKSPLLYESPSTSCASAFPLFTCFCIRRTTSASDDGGGDRQRGHRVSCCCHFAEHAVQILLQQQA